MFKGAIYESEQDEDEDDVVAHVRVLAARSDDSRRSIRTAADALDRSRDRREPIPREVRYTVWERDGGKCVECGASFDLQYDHIIPLAFGGANRTENIQLLCGDCNRRKGATLG